MGNAINWFEIPSEDFSRAVQFYSTVLGAELTPSNMGGIDMAVLPYDEQKVGGAVVHSPMHKSGAGGSLIYLNADGQLDAMLERITLAGGTVHVPKTLVSADIGYMAIFGDTEGNTLALHSST